ncbi:hypothetical protein [Shewanella goraebulensis]|uniref:hypothetical protein n=1 Tax=Shewanella goraebulensis TaxID=3050637 RepID=UPI00254F02D7|nr:hypothetical protein [Shewanella goraebulensis]
MPDAIRLLFNIDVATESQLLRNKADSFVRNKLIKIAPKPKLDDHRYRTELADKEQLTVLFNALLLNAIFHDPKNVKRIFENKAYRDECALVVKAMFGESHSVMGIAITSISAHKFVDALAGDFNLYKEKLPNPFAVLPQIALGKNLNLLHALLAQSAAMEPTDNLLLAYIQGNFDKAANIASLMPSENDAVNQLKQHVEKEVTEAVEFDDLVEQFRNM